MPETLFEHCASLIVAPRRDAVLAGGSLLVRDDLVVAVGTADEVRDEVLDPEGLDVVDCRHRIVLPGLVNAHNHNAWGVVTLAPFASRGAEPNPYEVLDGNTVMEEYVLAPMAWFTPESTYDLTVSGILHQLAHGTTTTTDAHNHPDALYAAAVDTGIRAVLHPQMITSITLDGLDEDGYLEQAEDCLRNYHVGGSPLVQVGVHPNWPWNCTGRLLRRGMELAQQYDAQFATHLYEVVDEVERSDEVWSDRGGGLGYLDSLGLLNDRALFFHGTELADADIDRLADAGCALVHNPQLNLQLWGRTARVQRWLDAGLTAGLGTDYGQFDLFTAMTMAGTFHKIIHGGHEMDPWELLALATTGSARALRMEDRVGTLEVGTQADVVTIDLDRHAALVPFFDDPQWVVTLLTTQAAGVEVAESMVAGRLLRRDGEFTGLDEAEVLGRARQWCDRFAVDFQQMRQEGPPWHRRVHEMFSRD